MTMFAVIKTGGKQYKVAVDDVFDIEKIELEDGAAVTFMGYANRWYSTDQIPERAVNSGLISLWGTLNPMPSEFASALTEGVL